MSTEELSCRVAEAGGIATVEVRGELTARSSAVTLVPVLRKLLLDRGRLLVDLRGVRAGWPAALAAFPSVLAGAGGWPLARMVLWGAAADLATALRVNAVTATVPLGRDRAEALALLDRRPRRVRRATRLPAAPTAAAFARSLIRSACDDWAVDPSGRQAAVLVGSELVSNAVVHARGTSLLTLGLDERGLRVSVRDSGPLFEAVVPAEPRLGLRVVAELSTAWGVARHDFGKSVWAMLAVDTGPAGPAAGEPS
ncbi:ATP-binding protein [Pseudonocardia humida]|uniref:ATP-binding protein n=1 Tax=Pseudonocardia humida TaxID=2800819 RepID=A0ABT1A1Z4_9PSEU|nr:ATP-binding protein [Pseudonocardia humida]MCO1657012.1 ATP-binding protein [Pseudonocardia humida]